MNYLYIYLFIANGVGLILSNHNGLIDLLTSEKSATKNGVKRSHPKGIITSDPFMDVTHLWPFQSATYILTNDIITGHKGILANGANIVKNVNNGSYASTEYPGSYIICGDFEGTCFSNPSLCIMGGMTISFWLRLNSTFIHDKLDQYIISSGAQSLNSLGFAFLLFHGKFAIILSTHTRQWNMRISKESIPLNTRINIAFVWDSNKDTLILYLNGLKKMKVKGEKIERKNCNFTVMTIGRPNNARDERFMMPLQISYFALWDRTSTSEQIKTIYENVKEKLDSP